MTRFIVNLNSAKFIKFQSLSFQGLLRYAIIRRIKRVNLYKSKMNRISICFIEWKKYFVKEKIVRAVQSEKNENLLKIIMVCWKRFLSYKDKKRNYQVN